MWGGAIQSIFSEGFIRTKELIGHQPAVGASILLAGSNEVQKAASGRALLSSQEFSRYALKRGILCRFLGIIFPPLPPGPSPSFSPNQPGQCLRLPSRPMLGRVGQQGVAGENTYRDGHGPGMQWTMMGHPYARLIPDCPTMPAGPAA